MRYLIVPLILIVSLGCRNQGFHPDPFAEEFVKNLESIPQGAPLDAWDPSMSEESASPVTSKEEAARELGAYARRLADRHGPSEGVICSVVGESDRFFFMEVRPKTPGRGFAIAYVEKNTKRLMLFNHR